MDGRDLVYIKVYRGEGEEERVEVVCALQSLVIRASTHCNDLKPALSNRSHRQPLENCVWEVDI